MWGNILTPHCSTHPLVCEQQLNLSEQRTICCSGFQTLSNKVPSHFQSCKCISKVETQLPVGLMFFSHFWKSLPDILEYCIYSSRSRFHIALAFLYTQIKIFSRSVLLCSLSLNISFALTFAFIFCHKSFGGRCLSFVTLFNKYLLNKDILLSFSRVTSVPGHNHVPQTCTVLCPIPWLCLFSPSPIKYLRENMPIYSV